MGHLEIEEVAIEAATLYGQDWLKIPAHSKEKWKEAIRTAGTQPHSAGETTMEVCAQNAFRAWHQKQLPAPEHPPIKKTEPVKAPQSKK